MTNVFSLLESVPTAVIDSARNAYRSGFRVYHTWDHALDVLGAVGSVEWDHPLEACLAALFHDAVYVVGADDNELRSAELFLSTWKTFVGDEVPLKRTLVTRSIRATAFHLMPTLIDASTAVYRLMDCDMAGLGLPYEEFRINSISIEDEYVPSMGEANFLHGRKRFWEKLLARPTIFRTPAFAHLEWRARQNIQQEMEMLLLSYLPSGSKAG